MGTKKRKERRKQRHTGGVSGIVGHGSAKQAAFLAAYATCGLIGRAATSAACDRSSHQNWMETDPEYPAKFRRAQDAANEVLEAEARRRAVEGMRRMKFYRGEPIIDPTTGQPYVEHEYSDRLLELALKAHLPEKYVDRSKVETTNIDGGEVPTRVQELLDDPARLAFEQEQDIKHLGAESPCEPPESAVK